MEILKYGTVRKEFGDMLTKQPDLVKKLGISLQKDGNKRMWAEISEDIDVLEKIFDMLIGDKLKGKRGIKRENS